MTRTMLSWSSGKDSAWALHRMRENPDIARIMGGFVSREKDRGIECFAFDGPMFGHGITIEVGEATTRDGFVFTDLLPA